MNLQFLITEVCRLSHAADSFEWAEVQNLCPGQVAVPISVYADIPAAPEREELRKLLRTQSPGTIFTLLTLWRLGRGDFDPRCNLLDEYLKAGDSFPNVHAVRNYLMGKQLPSYLERAVRLLKKAEIE
jgi:hypothetical protein